ncbi:hypothetical protein NJI34_04670 [Pseudomonas sp. S 311-6]|uniref:hypothetical protein n=1 Tax=Pseudomonas TaxID=286 RepID=UPI0020978305|nr:MULTISPECIES: hypothetical protein [Pseudomonas]MCO7563424.1 hypothetical protein [Pseudomonas mosselii]MCO7614933.1 hypothetical protein [Pseudomonas guariconensis]MCO7615118.1 hypothetical protein [Pseudomonas guariconensis]MCO7636080.1 hypothetical protein [Pseudomonas sp. S 311-6]
MTENTTPLSAENTLALASSLGLPLAPERAALIAGVLHHVHTVIARLDELPIETSSPPAFVFDATWGSTSC